MCAPQYFDVTYSINAWMDVGVPVDNQLARQQWQRLVQTYERLGHQIDLVPPIEGQPDMVFTANSGLVIDGKVLGARFHHPERRGESMPYLAWFEANGFAATAMPSEVNEGEGDLLFAGGVILAGHGFRSTLAAHAEASAYFDREVVSLELVDPRFYHLDTCLAVLDEGDRHGDGAAVMYFPGAFSPAGVAEIERRFPDAIVASEHDALAFGLNAASDGHHVVVSAAAHDLAEQLRARGYEPVPVDVSELAKAGGGIKCCTLELRGAPMRSIDLASGDRDSSAVPAAVASRDAAPRPSSVAQNYHPLPVTLVHGEGSWVTDTMGTRYLDLLAAYSALNFGHRHPRLVAAAAAQLDRLTLTSRAFNNDQLEPFCADLAELCDKEIVLTMNTGAEAVETGIKAARRWGYQVKGVAPDPANIIAFDDNVPGRTTTLIGFSSDPDAKDAFGPFTPGFRSVPYGDAAAAAAAIDANTVAILVEPIQGEAGVVVPPDGFLTALRTLCTDHHVLLIADEIQSGLGRTGTTFACDHEDVRPDVYLLGKALGGGIMPLSAVVADRAVMDVFSPGSHGSTFGGNPLACAVGREVIALLRTGEHQRRAAELGASVHGRLRALAERDPAVIRDVRGRGLWFGIEFGPDMPTGRAVCEALLQRRVLAKDTHGRTIRLAPPLTISDDDMTWAIDQLEHVMAGFGSG
jgi:ornithine--oxo-acid transaminase